MNAEERKGKVAEIIDKNLEQGWGSQGGYAKSHSDQAAQAIDEFYEADKKAEIEKAMPKYTEQTEHTWNYGLSIRNKAISEIRKSLLGG